MDSERNAERHYYADNNRTKVQEAGQLKDLREASILYEVETDSGQWKKRLPDQPSAFSQKSLSAKRQTLSTKVFASYSSASSK